MPVTTEAEDVVKKMLSRRREVHLGAHLNHSDVF